MIADPRAARGPRVILCSRRAAKSGICPGMPLAEALAIESSLHVIDEDLGEDVQALERLAEWAGRFSPTVALEECPRPQCLLLDLTGCAGCFGGEAVLLHQAVDELQSAGWVARVAIADTAGAAWGVAHYGRTPGIVPPGGTREFLLPFPIAALRLPSDASHLLAQLGIERIAQLAELPRDSLPHRVGPAVLQRLDQALGRLPEIVAPHRPLAGILARFAFEHPTGSLPLVSQVLDGLTEQLHVVLCRRHQGARQVECRLHHEDAPPTQIEVNLSRPSRSPQHLGLLLRTHLEQVRVASPVAALSLRVSVAEPLPDFQNELFGAEHRLDGEELSVLIDSLSNRLGREAVTRARLVSDPQPEYACRFEPLVQEMEKPSGGRRERTERVSPHVSEVRTPLTRPLRLWPVPEPIDVLSVIPEGPPTRITWAGKEYRVVRSWGPERIETGWWRGDDIHRDYYVAATDRGSRFWVFRRGDDGRWFLHGSFD